MRRLFDRFRGKRSPADRLWHELVSKEEGIELLLEWALEPHPQVTLLGVSLAHRQLFIMVEIERFCVEAFLQALGAIHGAVAEMRPKAKKVIIKDMVTGQRIAWRMQKAIACYEGRITFEEFRTTWKIINPRR